MSDKSFVLVGKISMAGCGADGGLRTVELRGNVEALGEVVLDVR